MRRPNGLPLFILEERMNKKYFERLEQKLYIIFPFVEFLKQNIALLAIQFFL